MDSDRSTRYEEMSSSGEVQGRRLRRAAAQENASGKAGIPVKGGMTVKELKQHGFIYFECNIRIASSESALSTLLS